MWWAALAFSSGGTPFGRRRAGFAGVRESRFARGAREGASAYTARDSELTADLTAEVFAAALAAAGRYRPGERPALAWLYEIAAHKLADSRRRGRVEDDARRRLALGPLTVDDQDLARVEEMADAGAAEAALAALPPGQRDAPCWRG
ncbi:MAG: sigma factor [Solirubrobacteraceae bacterium]